MLKAQGVTHVHYRADGAGCFSGSVAKAAIITWPQRSGVVESSYKISVPGCGKTRLDGLFGLLTMHLLRQVDAGASYTNAEGAVDLLISNPLNATHVHLYTPDRTKRTFVASKVLNNSYLLKYDEDRKEVIVFQHSRHGEGKIVNPKEIESIIGKVKGIHENNSNNNNGNNNGNGSKPP